MTINKNIFILLFIILLLSPAIIASAQGVGAGSSGGGDKVGAGEAKQCTGNDPANELCNPISVGSPQELIGKIIVAVLGIVGSLALLMFIYGGFTWMTAGGNQESITKGKNILVWATIGLIIIFSSYAIVIFVFEGVGANVQ